MEENIEMVITLHQQLESTFRWIFIPLQFFVYLILCAVVIFFHMYVYGVYTWLLPKEARSDSQISLGLKIKIVMSCILVLGIETGLLKKQSVRLPIISLATDHYLFSPEFYAML